MSDALRWLLLGRNVRVELELGAVLLDYYETEEVLLDCFPDVPEQGVEISIFKTLAGNYSGAHYRR